MEIASEHPDYFARVARGETSHSNESAARDRGILGIPRGPRIRLSRGAVMTKPRILLSAFGACGGFLLIASSNPGSRPRLSAQSKAANPISGEGLPNPAPKVTRNWGELPAGRKWGTSAGLDVDPKDGHIWGYERCGSGTA